MPTNVTRQTNRSQSRHKFDPVNQKALSVILAQTHIIGNRACWPAPGSNIASGRTKENSTIVLHKGKTNRVNLNKTIGKGLGTYLTLSPVPFSLQHLKSTRSPMEHHPGPLEHQPSPSKHPAGAVQGQRSIKVWKIRKKYQPKLRPPCRNPTHRPKSGDIHIRKQL